MDDRQYLAEQSKLWAGKPLGPGDGFDFKPVLNAVIKHPRVDSVSRRTQLVTDTQQLLSIDVYKQPLVSHSRWSYRHILRLLQLRVSMAQLQRLLLCCLPIGSRTPGIGFSIMSMKHHLSSGHKACQRMPSSTQPGA